MKDLMDRIAALTSDERHDLICYLHLKYQEETGKANVYNWWPGYLKDASPRLKEMLKLDEDGNSRTSKPNPVEPETRNNRPPDYRKDV